jgi:hypothetical protein
MEKCAKMVDAQAVLRQCAMLVHFLSFNAACEQGPLLLAHAASVSLEPIRLDQVCPSSAYILR